MRGAIGKSEHSAALAFAPLAFVAFLSSFATASYARVFENEGKLWDDINSKNAMTNGSFMSGQLLLGHAKVLLDRKRHDIAIPKLELALTCETPSIDTYFNLAAAYVDVGRYAEADKLYREALATEPNHAVGLSNLGNLRLLQYQTDAPEKQLGAADTRLIEAYNVVQRSLQLNPRSLNAWNILGSVCTLMGRPQEAQTAWSNALKLDPNNLTVQTNQAAALARAGKKAEAVAKIESLIAAHPNDVDLLVKAANAYVLLGEKATALDRLRRAQELDANNGVVRSMIEQLQKSGG
jgi:Flp pilus assembly protein TadD